MVVSGREAVRILASVVTGDAQARVLLRSGLAGRAIATPRGPMYDADAVRALTGWPTVDRSRLTDICPHGLYVARLQLPWVATLCGFVVFGAELVGFGEQVEPIPRTFFVLRPPGAWFDAIEGRRLPTRPGGRPWYLWTPPLA